MKTVEVLSLAMSEWPPTAPGGLLCRVALLEACNNKRVKSTPDILFDDEDAVVCSS
jgi:hypothetical protein